MVVPLQQRNELLINLTDRFVAGNFISDAEKFKYFGELSKISKSDAQGNMTWAFYYACIQDEESAVCSFKNALCFNTNTRFRNLVNFLFYLDTVGKIKEYVSVISHEIEFLKPQPSYSSWLHVSNYYLLSGRFNELSGFLSEIRDGLDSPQSIEGMTVLKNKLRMALAFEEHISTSEEQIKKVTSILVDIADSKKLGCLNIIFDISKGSGLSFLTFYTSFDSADVIADANLEIADIMADDPDLSNIEFTPMFSYSEPLPSIELN